jgi:hypothetical protein
MNRRDLIRTLLGTAAVGGTAMSATIVEAAPNPPPFLLFLSAPGPISADLAARLSKCLGDNLTGTVFAGVRVVVLGDGFTVKAIGHDGRELTRPVDVKPGKASRRRPRRVAAS